MFHRAAAEIYFIHSYIFIRINREELGKERGQRGRIFVILIYIVAGRQSITVAVRLKSFMIRNRDEQNVQKLLRYVSGELLTEISDV